MIKIAIGELSLPDVVPVAVVSCYSVFALSPSSFSSHIPPAPGTQTYRHCTFSSVPYSQVLVQM